MDQHQPNTNPDIFPKELKLDDTSRRHIASLAQWAMIVVVTAVVGYVLSLIQVFTASPATTETSEGFSQLMPGAGEGIGSVIFGVVIGLIINYFLYQFAVQSRKSLSGASNELLGSSFRNLKIYFIIVTIILICVFLIAMIAALALM